jgi:nicotinamide-nucleotide amidase
MAPLEFEIGELLRRRGLTLGAVESATGGLISHMITNVPGSSDYFKGSVTSYSNEVKINIIGVKRETLEKYGAVSSQVAQEMAEGGRRLLGVDICVADTGIAGPGGATPGKAVGLFYLGLAHGDGVSSRRYEFHGAREENKRQAAEAALGWVKEWLVENRE